METSLVDSWWGIAGAFAAFVYFALGAIGYGIGLANLLRPRSYALAQLSEGFLFGSLLLVVSAFLLAALGWLHLFPRLFLWLSFAPGLLFWRSFFRATDFSWRGYEPWLALLLFIFFLRSLSASLPLEHGDPLLYHLLGPRLWMNAGRFAMDAQLPYALLASAWECLYIWPQLLWWQQRALFGLVEAQVFSQWLHLWFGWGGCFVLLLRLFQGQIASKFLPLLGIAGIFVAGLQWTAPLAKNDVGITFWVLGALLFFRDAWNERAIARFILSGIFAGLAIAGKITAILSLAPMLAVLTIFYQPWQNLGRSLKFLAVFMVALIGAASPFYLRNYLLSENPFFPMFAHVFPSPWLSLSWQAHFSQVNPANPLTAFPRLFTRLPDLMREAPWVIGALAGPFLLFPRLRSTEDSEPLVLLLGSLLAYALFVTTQAPVIELRYLSASLMIVASLGVWAIWRMSQEFLPSRAAPIFFSLLLVAVLAGSKLPVHLLRKIWASDLGVAYLRKHTGGEAKAWLRANSDGGFVLLVGENETYYLSSIGVSVIAEKPDLDLATRGVKDFTTYITNLCRLAQARYLLDTRPDNGGVQARFGADILSPAIVFSGQGAQIYDLRILEKSVGAAPLFCR